jgi:hypothetical protein
VGHQDSTRHCAFWALVLGKSARVDDSQLEYWLRSYGWVMEQIRAMRVDAEAPSSEVLGFSVQVSGWMWGSVVSKIEGKIRIRDSSQAPQSETQLDVHFGMWLYQKKDSGLISARQPTSSDEASHFTVSISELGHVTATNAAKPGMNGEAQ